MTKDFKLALEALAKAGGFTVEFECTYCGERAHGEDGENLHEMVAFIRPLPKEGDEE